MSMLLFVVAGVVLLAAPLAVLLAWAVVRESRNKAEWRDRALQAPLAAREQAAVDR